MLCTESDRPVSQLLLFIYWTIVIALHRKRSPCFTIITIYLLDNSYYSTESDRPVSQLLLFIYWTIVTAVSARYCCTYAEQARQLYTFMQ
ncbi:hypothetical protein [Okeania sp. KiyG1]|uniref:hypothetical protein n=1 Tax=Okeania sp. KiyG1 TaxID=2720165 RepID=UPI0019222388|nr:hypothetical protein [Okeania sp. KiyG1]